MKRIFIAIKVDAGETLQKIISSLQTELCNETIKWVSRDNIHITLAFLGDTDEERVKLIGIMLREKCEGYGRFDLIIRGTGLFKNMNDPRIIWAGIEPSGKLLQLNALIINGLKNAGVLYEEHPFNPHLTLGRIKHLKDKSMLKKIIDMYQNTQIERVPVHEIILYESILLQSGPVYKPLSKFCL